MQSVILTKELASQVTPRAGRVLLMVPKKDASLWMETEGGPVILWPETARDHRIADTHQKAYVLKVGFGPFWDEGQRYDGVSEMDFQPGDWVVFRPLLMELNAELILTDVRRVDARIQS